LLSGLPAFGSNGKVRQEGPQEGKDQKEEESKSTIEVVIDIVAVLVVDTIINLNRPRSDGGGIGFLGYSASWRVHCYSTHSQK
jgi:hypothetical protein